MLPDGLVARYPPERRDGGRLLVLGDGGPVDAAIPDLAGLLEPGDLLVANDTRVMRARVLARRTTGGAVEVLFLEAGDVRARAMVRPGRRLKEGEALHVDGEPTLRLAERHDDGTWTVECRPSPLAVMQAVGHVPLPPYLERPEEPSDRERYQTVYAGSPGAVAAPTAGLHLTEALIEALAARGVGFCTVTLHVGPGTFRNLRSEELDAGLLHTEEYSISRQTADRIVETRAGGGRVVAVGTTSTRTLESAATGDGRVRPGPGSTRLFIREGYRFEVVDLLLTNFHLPRSSLIMLVCAFGGRQRVMSAYRHAVEARYRFYSYGDAMLVSPARILHTQG